MRVCPYHTSEASNVLEIAHGILLHKDWDGVFRVLLGEKTEGEKTIIQPYGGKISQDDGSLRDTLAREFSEELTLPPQIADNIKNHTFDLGTFQARSDIDPDVWLKIHCFAGRIVDQDSIAMREQAEMKAPKWYTFWEILSDPRAGTLTKYMVATLGSRYHDAASIKWARIYRGNMLSASVDIYTRTNIAYLLKQTRKNQPIVSRVLTSDTLNRSLLANHFGIQISDNQEEIIVCYRSGVFSWVIHDGQVMAHDEESRVALASYREWVQSQGPHSLVIL